MCDTYFVTNKGKKNKVIYQTNILLLTQFVAEIYKQKGRRNNACANFPDYLEEQMLRSIPSTGNIVIVRMVLQ